MLSKSKFILGQQCHKSLWLKLNDYEETNPVDESAKDRLKAGNDVGEEAKMLFPGGVNIEFYGDDYQKMCDLTQEAIAKDTDAIYEASFIEDNIFIRVDIMHKTPSGWDIYEVKSSSALKDYHKEDLSLQWYVLNKVKNLELNKAYVVTMNNEYVKDGDIDPKEIFKLHDLTDEVLLKQPEIEKESRLLKLVSSSKDVPKINIGPHCKAPHGCVYVDSCWPKSSKDNDSIFTLYRMRLDKKIDLYNQGIDTFKKIESTSKFNLTQQNQIKAYRLNEPVIDKVKIKEFINTIEYPLSYFDFETFTDAIPSFNGQRPHMQIPFQYSLHIQENENTELKVIRKTHKGFIADHNKDPRRDIAESMLINFPLKGSIMAFNQSFEKNCIKSLAEHCPDLAKGLLDLNNRFVDLIDPFRGGGYYHSSFKGSFSLKNVLPAMCPNDSDLDYKKLEIGNGALASSAYKHLRDSSEEEIEQTRKNLSNYCWTDTYAMVAIYNKLLTLVGKI